jgi:hypothetical protein
VRFNENLPFRSPQLFIAFSFSEKKKAYLPLLKRNILSFSQSFYCQTQSSYIKKSAVHQTSFRKNSKPVFNLGKHHEQVMITEGGNTMKSSNIKSVGLLTLGLAFALSFGFAQTDSTSTDTSTSMSGGMLGDFSSYDADADSALTADELGQGLLTAYDTNADGSIDQTEFDAMVAMMGAGAATDSAATGTTDSTSTDTASSDTSSDTSTDTASTDTSTDTSTATASTSMVGDFTSLDANADGLLDAAELGQGFVTAYDTSGTGSLSETDFDTLAAAFSGGSTTTPTQ